MKNYNETQKRYLNGYSQLADLDQTKKIKWLMELVNDGLMTVEKKTNDYGYVYLQFTVTNYIKTTPVMKID